MLPSLHIGQHSVPYPILQGGMGVRISGANLAAAVANAGGVGVISSVGLGLSSPHFPDKAHSQGNRQQLFFEASRLALMDAIQKARALSPDGVIGINTMVADRNHDGLVRAAAAQGVNLIIAGAGLPLRLPELTADYPDVALVPIISSPRAAQVICRKWSRQFQRLPDAFIVEHPGTAGGHLGAKESEINDPALSVEQVVPALVAMIQKDLQADIPVIAAGGIWDRADIDRALALGASGVQIGTRFITTEECDAHPRYKAFHLQASAADVTLVPSPVGMPGRALRNPFVEQAIAGTVNLKTECLNCLRVCKYRDSRETYCILHALDRAARGDVETGLVFSGANAGRAQRLQPVAELMAELTAE